MSQHLPGYDAWATQGNEPDPEWWPVWFHCPVCDEMTHVTIEPACLICGEAQRCPSCELVDCDACEQCGHLLTLEEFGRAEQREPEKESDRD